jgi:glycosyltransferase involved in cell wall biosynthesis
MVDGVRRVDPALADRTHVLENGFDPVVAQERQPRRDLGDGEVRLVHAGPVHGYPGRTVTPLLAALRLAGDRFSLELVGAGEEVEGATVRQQLPWMEAVRAQAEADIGVVLYSSDPTAVGTKVFELLALGRPVLALVDHGSALHSLLRELGQDAGCVRHDDVEGMAAAIRRLADDPPPPVAVADLARWDRSVIAGRVAELLDELVSPQSRRRASAQ